MRSDANAVDMRHLILCAFIQIRYFYNSEITKHAAYVPRFTKLGGTSAYRNRGFLVLYFMGARWIGETLSQGLRKGVDIVSI
jgi:hypothetical protein